VTVAVEAPRAAMLHHLKARFVVTVEKLVGHPTCGVFVGQFQGFGPEPLHVDYSDQAIWKDPANSGFRLKVFETAHAEVTPDEQDLILGTIVLARFCAILTHRFVRSGQTPAGKMTNPTSL
jgi:hypothetical protein